LDRIKKSPIIQAKPAAFEEPTAGLASSPPFRNLKFERADWSLFRTVEGLQQKAGVAKSKLRRLVLKELTDNGLDAGANVRVGDLPDGGYFVEDNGPGIDGTPEEIARLFSIARPLVSTKLLRLPIRGALGNGLRVVAGAIVASEGFLVVITSQSPDRASATTTIVSAKAAKFPVGARIEISFGPALPRDANALLWARMACQLAREGGNPYAGKSSPWWYDVTQFHELLYASGAMPVRELISHLDGCTGAKAGEIVAAAELGRTICKDATRAQAEHLLMAAREHARQVKPKRLGAVGPIFCDCAYAYAQGIAEFGSVAPFAEVPFVVEAWAEAMPGGETSLAAWINRTPVTGFIEAARDKRDIDAYGCGLKDTIAEAPKEKQFSIRMNLTTPYMPITSDGKAPDLSLFLNMIAAAVGKAVRKAHRPNAGGKQSQKDIVLDNLDTVIADVSGDGEFRFNQRQLLYGLRPIVMNEIGEELKTANFTDIITDYENEHGEIPGMYREPRGSIYHPHRGETISLGTLMVEDYERPAWTFNKLVYVEKEGFNEALKAVRWPERHDCALISSKGFSSRAARDLVDKLAEHDEPVTIFCVHDADAAGGMIYQTFQEQTRARGARKIEIVNLGLEPWEALAMGLDVETVEVGKKHKPVAKYVAEHACEEDEGDWETWLQTHRIELNAMTTPRFIAWLDGKMAAYSGKLIPPAHVLVADLDERIERKVCEAITERILREAGLEDQVTAAIAAIRKPTATVLAKGIKQMFKSEPDREWRTHIEAIAKTVVQLKQLLLR
jgi:hypothetical protein